MVTRKVYQAEIQVYATIYVVAEDEDEAQAIILKRLGNDLQVGESEDVSSLGFDDHNLPDVSISPAMTIANGQPINVYFDGEYQIEEEDDG